METLNGELDIFGLLNGFWIKRIVVELVDETAIEGLLVPSKESFLVHLKNAIVYGLREASPVHITDCFIRGSRIRFIHLGNFGSVFSHLKLSMKKLVLTHLR